MAAELVSKLHLCAASCPGPCVSASLAKSAVLSRYTGLPAQTRRGWGGCRFFWRGAAFCLPIPLFFDANATSGNPTWPIGGPAQRGFAANLTRPMGCDINIPSRRYEETVKDVKAGRPGILVSVDGFFRSVAKQ